ncbi:MAG: Vitamin B12 import ATP-binding protein BtuD [Enterocloster aldenensis]
MITSVRHLSMKFGNYRALDDVNLDIGEGEFVAVLGPSGCGKTTLLRLLAGFFIPSAGTISMNGSVVAENGYGSSPNQRNIGMVFQSYALWPHMTVFQQILFPLRHSRIKTWTKKDMEERAMEMLCLVGMGHLAGRYPSELSGGQRQRVALARSLADKPGLLLMDEPLSNLDAKLKIEMRKEISRIHRETHSSILYVTHDQSEAMGMADRIVIMKDGVVQQIGTPKEIFSNPANPFVAQFVGQTNLIPGKWQDDCFICGKGEVIRNRHVPHSFHKADCYPVKPEQVNLVEAGQSGLLATVESTEYQGFRSKILLALEDHTVIEALLDSRIPVKPGQTFGIKLETA